MKQPAHWSPVDSGSAPFSTSTAQGTASTTERNLTDAPSRVRLTSRPLSTAMAGSMRSLRKGPQPPESPVFVVAGEPAVSDHVNDQDRRKFARFGHRAPLTGPK